MLMVNKQGIDYAVACFVAKFIATNFVGAQQIFEQPWYIWGTYYLIGLLWWLMGKRIRLQCRRNVQEMQVQSLGQEDPQKEGMATHSSILHWKIPMDRGVWRATVHRVTKSQTRLSN